MPRIWALIALLGIGPGTGARASFTWIEGEQPSLLPAALQVAEGLVIGYAFTTDAAVLTITTATVEVE